MDIDAKAISHARRKGRRGMQEAAEKRIVSSVGRAQAELFRDGTQTPMGGENMLYYAQHATASCCRMCIEEWHGIPRNRPLATDEITYLAALTMRYIGERLPDLADNPVKVPPVRRQRVEGGTG